MNAQEADILKILFEKTNLTQRELAEISGHSLGIVNRALKLLQQEEMIDGHLRPTPKARKYAVARSPKNAIILAAGFGMRMIPINREIPKGLLQVKGEILIERLIRQLHEAGMTEIYIVVGFMKEQYEYLIDRYQVKLIVNPDYSRKNNLHSLLRAAEYLANSYIIPCDIRCEKNPFHKYELYSWYMVSNLQSGESTVKINRKKELVRIGSKEHEGNAMIGICYLERTQSSAIRDNLLRLSEDIHYNNAFWEDALFCPEPIPIQANLTDASDVAEINTYEQLRDIDSTSRHLDSDIIRLLAGILHTTTDEITEIGVLKKGMTNRSFLFRCGQNRYIMRIPGEGTSRLIDRLGEADVYTLLRGRSICDENIYINPANGYKVTKFIEHARVCDPSDANDVQKCMRMLRSFHEMRLQTKHEFHLFTQIDFYESLWEHPHSVYRDYTETKRRVLSLRKYIEAHIETVALCHIDAVPDNFLFAPSEDAAQEEKIYMIDWEYAGMQDPHIDIAMFGVYSFYDRAQMDRLIDAYFEGGCPTEIRIKIYCYIAACGLLWSNWCEYKSDLGVDFGEYSLYQYRYAKEYYRIVCDELGKECQKWDIKQIMPL